MEVEETCIDVFFKSFGKGSFVNVCFMKFFFIPEESVWTVTSVLGQKRCRLDYQVSVIGS